MVYRRDYPTSVRIPTELRARLVRFAQAHNYALSQAIVYVLQQGLAKLDPKKRRKKAEVSTEDQA